jgi:hypothetical protein
MTETERKILHQYDSCLTEHEIKIGCVASEINCPEYLDHLRKLKEDENKKGE